MGWFPEPQRITAAVFTRLPAAFRRRVPSAWADANKGGEPIDSFLEGPTFEADGGLLVTDIPHGRVFRIAREGTWSLVATWDGWPNGLALHPDGRLLVADYRRGLLALDLASGATTSVLPHVRSESFKGLNDLVVAPNGDVLVTDQGQTGMQDASGRVWRLTHDGRVERLLDTGPSPNGIALDPSGKHLFVAMTRACQVWRGALTRDAVLAKVGVFAHTPGGLSGPDGLAVTAEGGLVVANPGHGCAWVLDRHGVPVMKVESPEGRTVTNVAFDPADPHRLVMTESETGTILEARLPMVGHPATPWA